VVAAGDGDGVFGPAFFAGVDPDAAAGLSGLKLPSG